MSKRKHGNAGRPEPMNNGRTKTIRTAKRAVGFGRTAALGFLVAAGALRANVPYVVSPSSGEKIEGRGIERGPNGEILLRTDNARMTFPPDVVFYVPEPPEYGRAVNLLQQRNYEEAIRVLDGMIEKYADLQWDRRGRVLLAGAYYDKGEFDRSADLYQRIARENPSALDDEIVLNRYLEALRKSAREEALMAAIRDTVRNRSRSAAARAQMMRARIHMEKNAAEAALLDFMRTAELFVDVEEFQEEALAGTARAFERLEDSRAETYLSRLKENYPDSRFLEK